MKKINILIDGSNLCYRQYFILKDLSNSKGVPTGLYTGFIKTLYRLKTKYNPSSIVIAWDHRPKHRREIYPDYKGNRKKTEEHQIMFEQITNLKEILKPFNIGQVLVESEEADDVIASLLTNEYKDDLNYIYTTDFDLAQLIQNDKTLWLRPERTGGELILNEQNIINKYFLHPNKIAFFKAITGDSSDNIKGIPYFPKKVAYKICEAFDCIEDIKNHTLEQIKMSPNQYEKFNIFSKITEKYKPSLLLNYELVSLNKKIPLNNVLIPKYNRMEVESLFKELEIDSLLVQIERFHSIFEGTQCPTGPRQVSLF